MLGQHTESSSPFEQAFKTGTAGVAFLSMAEEWMKVNPAVTLLLGYSEEQLLGRSFSAFWDEDSLHIHSYRMGSLRTGAAPFLKPKSSCTMWTALPFRCCCMWRG